MPLYSREESIKHAHLHLERFLETNLPKEWDGLKQTFVDIANDESQTFVEDDDLIDEFMNEYISDFISELLKKEVEETFGDNSSHERISDFERDQL